MVRPISTLSFGPRGICGQRGFRALAVIVPFMHAKESVKDGLRQCAADEMHTQSLICKVDDPPKSRWTIVTAEGAIERLEGYCIQLSRYSHKRDKAI